MEPEAIPARDKIVAASFQLFLAHGYDGTGLSQILKASGLSKGAFYHYFPTKEAVYKEVVNSFFLKPMLGMDFEEIRTNDLKDTRASLTLAYEQLPEAVAAAGVDMTRYFALFFESLSRLPEFKEIVQKHYAKLLNAFAQRTYDEHEIFPKVAKTHSRNVIANLEGRLFLAAVLDCKTLDIPIEVEEKQYMPSTESIAAE